jgi:ectoine hydroxylase-related dioxygenase (phytanoyl-CoA dioxygenase family)
MLRLQTPKESEMLDVAKQLNTEDVKAFFDATPLLPDSNAIQQRMAQDGYLFLKSVADPEVLVALRDQITAICDRYGWMKSGVDHRECISDHTPVVEGDDEYLPIYTEVQRLEAFHALAHEPGIMSAMRAVLGETAFPHPLSICRLVFPNNFAWATPAHQDYPNNQGSEDLYASWIPLVACPQTSGSLAILSGSNRLGLLPLEYSLGAGHRRCVLDDRHQKLDWVSSGFELGDILIFHSLTIHKSLENQSESMRISVDYRYQREGENMSRACLRPHFSQDSWERIYSDWKRPELQYYWRDKNVVFQDWDADIHALPADHFKDALRLKGAYDKQRLSDN